MNELQIFRNERFGDVRTLTGENGETFFVGKDVAKALGYSNTRDALNKHVDAEDKLVSQIATSGQRRAIIFINESGNDVVAATLRFSTHEYQGQVFQEILATEIVKI